MIAKVLVSFSRLWKRLNAVSPREGVLAAAGVASAGAVVLPTVLAAVAGTAGALAAVAPSTNTGPALFGRETLNNGPGAAFAPAAAVLTASSCARDGEIPAPLKSSDIGVPAPRVTMALAEGKVTDAAEAAAREFGATLPGGAAVLIGGGKLKLLPD